MPEDKKKKGFGIGSSLVSGVKRDIVAPIENVASLASATYGFPLSGLAGLAGLGIGAFTKKGSLETGRRFTEAAQKALVYEPQTEKGRELAEIATAPIRLAGEGLGGLAELASTGDIQKAAKVIKGESEGSNIAVPIAKTIGEASAVLPGFGKALKEAKIARKRLPIEESAVDRGLSALQIEAKQAIGKLRSEEGAIGVAIPRFNERRQNQALRKKVADMTPDERAQALLTDPLTNQKNKRAYEEAERLPYQASIDVDGLKYVNDTYGHEAGNLLLKRVGEALENASEEGRNYHFHGDEFALEGLSKTELGEISRKAKEYLKENPIEVTDAEGKTTLYTPDFSIGIAETLDAADKAMLMNKKVRRVERGAGPAVETPIRKALEKDGLDAEIRSEMSTEELQTEIAAIEPPVKERPVSVVDRIRQEVEKAELPEERAALEASLKETKNVTISSRTLNNGTILIEAKDNQGDTIGKGRFIEKDNELRYEPGGILYVEPQYRRSGIATSIFKKAEEITGKKVKRGAVTTPEGKSFLDAYYEKSSLPKEAAPVTEPIQSDLTSVKDNTIEFKPVLSERGTLDVKQTKEQLPPIYPGNVRLYRVEKAPTDLENVPDALKKAPTEYQPERYYTSDLDYAGYYQEAYGPESTLHYIDIPKSVADQYKVPGKKTQAEFLLPEEVSTVLPEKASIVKKKPTLATDIIKAEREAAKQPVESLEPILLTNEVKDKPTRSILEQSPKGPLPGGPKPPSGGVPRGPQGPKVLTRHKGPGGVLPASDGAFKLGVERFLQYFVNNRFALEKVQNRLKQMDEGLDLLLREVNRPKQVTNEMRNAWDNEVKPILKTVVESGKTQHEFEMYAYAVHAPEVNRVLRLDNAKFNLIKVFKAIGKTKRKEFLKKYVKKGDKPTPQNMYNLLNLALNDFGNYKKVQRIKADWDKFSEKPSGLTDAEAAALQQQYANNPKFEEARLKLRSLVDKTLDMYHDAGIIPDKEYVAMKNKYKEYVPLHREGFEEGFKSTGQGIQPAGRPYKTRSGSTRRAVDIITHVVANYNTAIQRVAKAESDLIFAKMINANPDPAFWSIHKVNQTPRRDVYGNISYYPNINDVGKHEMRTMIKGKQYLISVDKNNPTLMRMLDVLKGSPDSQVGSFVRVVSKANRYFARVATIWSPEFMFGNFPKDLETGLINIHSTGVKLPSVRNVLKGALKSVGTIYKMERGAEPKTQLDLLYSRFKNAGGKIDWSDSYKDIPDLAKKISVEFDMLKGKRIPRKVLTSMGKLISDANTAVENGVRLHTFKLATDQGFSDAQAARIASQITVDFTQHGTAGPVINGLWLFANASIGGNYRMIQGMIKSKTIRYKIVPSIIAAGFVNTLYNNWLGGDDEDGQTYFNKTDDFIKERNMVFMIPGTKGGHATIPLAYGYGFFWNFGGEMARAVSDVDYKAIEGGARMLNSFSNSFNPIGSSTLVQTITPTLLDPLIQIAENKTWFGGDLIPAENPFEKIKTPDSERSWRETNPSLKWVARELNSFTGGTKVRPGLADISPETMDLWLDTIGGSALTFVKRSFSIPEKLITREDIALREIPFVRRFAGSKSEWADSRTYYDNVTQVLTVKDELETYKDDPLYKSLDKKYGFMRQLFASARVSEYSLRQARSLKRFYEVKELPQLVERQEKIIQDIYVEFNKKFYNVVKEHRESD